MIEKNNQPEQPEEPSRRELLKTAAITAAGLMVGASVLSDKAEAQEIKLRQVAIDRGTAQKMTVVREAAVLNSKSVLPDGKLLGRAEILSQLNLNPNTPPEAWLAVFGCGVNASALNFRDAQQLVNKGILDKAALQTIRQ
jgi:hypothetical protein